jgi:hypothetical protein
MDILNTETSPKEFHPEFRQVRLAQNRLKAGKSQAAIYAVEEPGRTDPASRQRAEIPRRARQSAPEGGSTGVSSKTISG